MWRCAFWGKYMDYSYNMYLNRFDFLSREFEESRDSEYLKAMYPKDMRRIQSEIEDQCDKLEYDGSLMFDEYPDMLLVRKICKDILANVWDEDNAIEGLDRKPYGDKTTLEDIIKIVLLNEMFKRRCRRRNRRIL